MANTPPVLGDTTAKLQTAGGSNGSASNAHTDDIKRDGRSAVLVVSTLTFTLFFAVWVMFAIVGLPMRAEFGLTESQFATLIALPILIGSLLRVPMGMLADRYGGRNVMTGLLVFCAIPTALVGYADSYNTILILAALLGMSGTSFAVGIAWVSAWYPANRQGVALGTFGMGNVGASITKIMAPTLVTAVGTAGLLGGVIPGGWRFVPVAYAFMLLCMAAAVWAFSPRHDLKPAHGRSIGELLRPLRIVRVWRFGLYYVMVFGAYVALSLWLPKYYVDVYGISLTNAGLLTALFIFPASLLRPFGGWMSDRWGPRVITYISFFLILGASAGLTRPAGAATFTLLILVVGFAMGIGKASVYTYVPEYFPKDVGVVGGLVGCVGGLGGYILPKTFAYVGVETGDPRSIFYVLGALAAICIMWLTIIVIGSRHHEDKGVM